LSDTAERRVYSPVELLRYAQAAEGMGRADEAERLFKLLWESTGHPDAAMQLSLYYERTKRFEASEAVCREALAAHPAAAAVERQLAFLLLRQGRFAEGWRRYEARWRMPGDRRRPTDLAMPEWSGKPVESLLIWPEQGLGDQIQYLRYARALVEKGVAVTMVCAPSLERLFAHAGVETVVVADNYVEPPT
jgi:hypothetical protein